MKKIVLGMIGILLLCCITLYAALYTPDREQAILSRLKALITLQNHIYNTYTPEQKGHLSYNIVSEEMEDKQAQTHALLAKLVDNLFELKLYPKIENIMRKDFAKKNWGNPFISSIKLEDPLTLYVVSDTPTADTQFDRSSDKSVVEKTYSVTTGVRHFDQRFETLIYDLSNRKGLMVIRGNYAFFDFDLNGIPDTVYFMNKYRDEHRHYWHYLTLIGNGEDVLGGGSYQARYLDSLLVVLEYILDHYPIIVPIDNDSRKTQINM